jgi:hypothetical protein
VLCDSAWLTSVIYPSCLQYHGRGNGFIPIAEYGLEFTKNTKQWKKKTPVRLLYSGRNHYDLLVWHSCRAMYFSSARRHTMVVLFFVFIPVLVPLFWATNGIDSVIQISVSKYIYFSFACFDRAYFSLVFLAKMEATWQQFHGWIGSHVDILRVSRFTKTTHVLFLYCTLP